MEITKDETIVEGGDTGAGADNSIVDGTNVDSGVNPDDNNGSGVVTDGDDDGDTGDQTLNKPTKTQEEINRETEPTVFEQDVIMDKDMVYNGENVTVTIPMDVANTFEQAGINGNEVVTELYKGEFGLSPETIQSMADKLKVPGALISTALDGIRAQNDLFQKGVADKNTAAETAATEAWTETLEQVGSEENWSTMESWAASNWNTAKFQDFNKVMETGSRYMQKLAIEALKNEYVKERGELDFSIVEGAASTDTGLTGKGFLTKEEYQNLLSTGKYNKYSKQEQATIDSMRRKGQAKGV